jgi:hypothetical protein
MVQQLINDQVARYNFQQSLPYQKLAEYAGKVMGNFGGQGASTTTGAGLNPLMGALGGALTGLGTAGALGEAIPAFANAGPWGLGVGALLGLLGALGG